jgi:hypothetical protein
LNAEGTLCVLIPKEEKPACPDGYALNSSGICEWIVGPGGGGGGTVAQPPATDYTQHYGFGPAPEPPSVDASGRAVVVKPPDVSAAASYYTRLAQAMGLKTTGTSPLVASPSSSGGSTAASTATSAPSSAPAPEAAAKPQAKAAAPVPGLLKFDKIDQGPTAPEPAKSWTKEPWVPWAVGGVAVAAAYWLLAAPAAVANKGKRKKRRR